MKRVDVPGSRLSWMARYAAPTVLLILFGTLILGRSSTASGYNLNGRHWPFGSAVVMSLQLGNHGQGSLTDGSLDFNVSAQQAADLWNNQLGSNVRILMLPNGSGAGINLDSMSSVYFDTGYLGTDFDSSVLAITAYSARGVAPNQIFNQIDVVFNNTIFWDSYRGGLRVPRYDFRRVALHEFGHALGLDHSTANAAPKPIMTAIVSDTDDLQPDDLAGMRAIYGSYVEPSPTPSPTPMPLTGQFLGDAVGHVFSSPGDPVGLGVEAQLDGHYGYGTAWYQREVESGTGRTVHRFVMPRGNPAQPGPRQWVFTFVTAAGQDLANGTYDITASDQANPNRPFLVAGYDGRTSVLATAQLTLQEVTYSGTNLTSLSADFRLPQSTSSSNPQFLAGYLRFNTSIPLPPNHIVNLSTRVDVGADAVQAIAGFVMRDPAAAGKQALLRVLGPALGPRGVTGTLADPLVYLYAGPNIILSNNDWADGLASPSQSSLVQIGLEPPARTESALLNRFSDGAYTAVVSGRSLSGSPSTGIALVELYDLEIGGAASLINVSTRGMVGTGGSVMIAGFVIQGPRFKKVIIRALGPSLTARGVTGALQNPFLTLVGRTSNDSWRVQDAPQWLDAIVSRGLAPTDDRECAIYAELPAGEYTAIVSGVGNTTGVALVEVYDAD